jgi:ParB-like chromosome segregation protein Spo0J
VTFNIEWWDIDKVIPYAKNARKIRQSAIDKVAASIAEFGWRQPIVVDARALSPWATCGGARRTS